jgi:hypothetical protein
MNACMSRSSSRCGAFSALAGLLVAASLLSCSSRASNESPAASGGNGNGSLAGSGSVASGTGNADGVGGGPQLSVGGSSSAGGGAPSDVCATVTAEATLETVHLVFAFDVSGSMGKGDHPWHDAKLKWDPVVAATRAFFEDTASTGLLASLTAFPIDDDDDERCDAASYTEPDVEMQALPSTAFGEKLAAIRDEDWRGGTPTLAVIEGSLDFVRSYRKDHPGRYAIVLVTDGYPQGCDDDSIDSVKDAVSEAAETVPTYVIGVKNPPLVDEDGNEAPDTVSNLSGVAEAGGTDSPFIIATGEADKTARDFQAAIEKIRGVSVACNIELPLPPDRRAFEKDSVAVGYASAGARTDLHYDEGCADAASWHYDDVTAPTEVVLCPDTCTAVQAAPGAKLSVDFTCQPVINLPR